MHRFNYYTVVKDSTGHGQLGCTVYRAISNRSGALTPTGNCGLVWSISNRRLVYIPESDLKEITFSEISFYKYNIIFYIFAILLMIYLLVDFFLTGQQHPEFFWSIWGSSMFVFLLISFKGIRKYIRKYKGV